MRTSFLIGTTLAVILFGVTSLGSSPAWAVKLNLFNRDKSVCYSLPVDFGEEVVLRLNVKEHSPLTNRKEKKEHGHPIQTTYSALGKLVTRKENKTKMASVNGLVLVAEEKETRLKLTWFDGLTPVDLFFFSPQPGINNMECASNESSPTPDGYSSCTFEKIYGGSPIGTGEMFADRFNIADITFWEKVNPLENELCSEFPGSPF